MRTSVFSGFNHVLVRPSLYITFFEYDSGIKWTAAVALGDATPPGRSVHDGFPGLVHMSVELT